MRISFSVLTLLGVLFVNAFAAGPLILRAPGEPFRWPNGGQNIPFNPDQGGLGPLTNAQAVSETTDAFGRWAAIPTSTVTHVNAGALAIDVDETNFVPFFDPAAPDGLSAIVYDEDGAIFDLLFGPNSGVLGFAGPEWVNPTTGEILEGSGFMNGGAFIGVDPFPISELGSLLFHEFGHYHNLAHTVINGQIVLGDFSGPAPNDTFPIPSLVDRIETMYPFLFIGGGQATPHKDDVSSISTIYPEPTFAANTGTITGQIISPNNTTLETGVNVIARNTADPFDDAVSAISSDFTDNFTQGQPFVGVYTLRGLTPGANYAIYVDGILAGGFSTPPRALLPGPEEFYNGASESSSPATDDPSIFTPVAAAAGATQTGIDIVFNRFAPGPIPVSDDGSVELFPQFPIELCGQRYESLFVNGNGNITFGAPSASFAESQGVMLTGPPRIAGVWDDLDPSSGGVVSFSESSNTFTVRFENVPQFFETDSNTFEIKINRKVLGFVGNAFKLSYGDLGATDGLTGYSCGGRVTSGFETERNFSSFRNTNFSSLFETAVFEQFTAEDNDLDNSSVQFVGTIEPEDPLERNNTISRARNVSLPFDSSSRLLHTEIEPTGNDVDYYKFRGRTGEIFVAETVPGLTTMDTIIGLFDRTGTLIAADDDGGAGVLSRVVFTLPANGDYYVAVSTFGDDSFTGAGTDFGRYVLTLNSYRGTVLPVGDDSSVQVPLGTFSFPYQGTNWTSVYVNGNGNLTFGAGDEDFSETPAEFLAGPPRISPLWDDLSPANLFTGLPQGLVIAEEKNRTLTIHYVSIPEFIQTGTNYLSVTLDRHGGVEFDYGATNRSNALVGITQGNGAADPGPVDLSRSSHLSKTGTTYEQFLGSFTTYTGNDLSFKKVRFR